MNLKRREVKTLFLFLAASLMFGCTLIGSVDDEIGSGTAAYEVVYNANGSTDGYVPTDRASYAPWEVVEVKPNDGDLKRVGYTFTGWNTAQDGSGDTYKAGETFSINSDVTLYAFWTNEPPAVTVDSPGEGDQFSKNDIITFSASVSDREDDLPDLDITWLVGNSTAGEGNPLSLDAGAVLGIGEHTVTLEVTDIAGASTSASVVIEVLDTLGSGIEVEF